MKIFKNLTVSILALTSLGMLTSCGHKHTLVLQPGTAATCTDVGSKDYYKCIDSSCGMIFYDEEGLTPITIEDILLDKLTIPASEHTYNQQIANDQYLATQATCEAPARYYFSCVCGNKGSETFPFGDALCHDMQANLTDPDSFTCSKNDYFGRIYDLNDARSNAWAGAEFDNLLQKVDYGSVFDAHNHNYVGNIDAISSHPETAGKIYLEFDILSIEEGVADLSIGIASPLTTLDKNIFTILINEKEVTYDNQQLHTPSASWYVFDCTNYGKAQLQFGLNTVRIIINQNATCNLDYVKVESKVDITIKHDISIQSNSTHHWFGCNCCNIKYSEQPHIFNQTNTDQKFKVSSSSGNIYYKSCLCGAKGYDTFTFYTDENGNKTLVEEQAQRIIVTSPIKKLTIGDKINLDDYIEVVGVEDENNYFVTVNTPDTVTLEGHILTVIGEGSIRVDILAGANRKKAIFSALSLSKPKITFDNKTQFTTNYFVENLKKDVNGNIIKSGEGIVHNSKYFAYPIADDNGNVTNYEGILETKSGKTYEFACADLAGKNLEVLPGPQVPIGQYYLTQPFSLNYMDFETLYDEKTGEAVALVCTDNTAISNYCMSTCGVYPPSDYASILYKNYKDQLGLSNVKLAAQELVAEFLYTDEEATMENAILSIMVIGTFDFTYKNGTKETQDILFSFTALSGDPELCTVKGVEDYINSGAEPEALKCDLFIEKLTEAATLRNYTQQTDYFWSTKAANSEYEIADPGMGLPSTTFVQAVTEDTIFRQEQLSETEYFQSFYTVNDGQLYYGDNYKYDENGEVETDANGNPLVGDSFTVDPIPGSSSIWDDPDYSLITLAAAADDSFYSNITVAGVQEANGYTVYDFGQSPELAAAMVLNAAGYGISLYNTYVQNQLFNYTYVSAIVTDSAIQVTVYLPVPMEDHSIGYYNIVSTFYKVGTTTAPDLSPLF